ncbi:MAG: peptidase (pitrilysin) family [Myxococcales bacterium]|nr:peptidase (pitrilysin) family [Myxococcales bacterium]
MALGAVAGLGCASGAPAHLVADPPELRWLSVVRALPSGLRVIAGHDRRQSVAAVSLVVGAGSANDPPGKAGLAHLVEHLTFRAHAEASVARDRSLDALGAEHDAATSFDLTTFTTFAFHDFWRDLVGLEASRLTDPLAGVDEETFALELDVVRAELSQREETHGSARGLGRLQEALFDPADPYAHGSGGTLESLATLTLEDARVFAKEHYRPENATLYVDGGMSEDVERDIDGALGALAGKSGANPTKPLAGRGPSATGARTSLPAALHVSRYPARVASPELWIGWVLPSVFAREGALVSLMHGLAGVQLSTDRLFADAEGVMSVSVSLERGTRASILVCHASLLPSADPDSVAQHIADHVSSMWATQIPQAATLQQRRNIVHNTALLTDDGLRARAAARPAFAHVTGDPRFFVDNLAATMKSLDQFDAGDFFRSHLSREQARAIYLEPSTEGRAPASTTRPRAPEPPLPAGPLGFAKLRPEALRSWESNLRVKTLANGLTAIVAPRGGVAPATVLLGFHGGTATARPKGAPEISAVAGVTSVTDMACGSLARCGVLSTGSWPGADVTSQSWAMDPALVNHTLEIVSEMQDVSWMEWPKGERARRYRDWDVVEARRPEVTASSSLYEGLYPGLAWGRLVTPRDLDAVDTKAAEQWTERHRSARNAVVIVAGDVDADRTLARIENEFGGWKAGDETASSEAPPLVRRPRPAFTTTAWPGAPQAQLTFGCRLPPSDARWSALLAKGIAARLDGALRRQKGLTYGFVSTSHAYRSGVTDLDISGLVANGALPQALSEIEAVVDDLGAGRWPAPAPDLEAGQAAGATPADHERWRNLVDEGLANDTNAGVARHILSLWNLGLPLTDASGTAAWLQSIDAPTAEELLRTCKETAVVAVAAHPQALPAELTNGTPVAPKVP